MIQEHEIRIGNAFQHDGSWSYRKEEPGEPYAFQWAASDWYALGECTLFLENVSAIPLTPEVLEKCGFTKRPDGNFWLFKEETDGSDCYIDVVLGLVKVEGVNICIDLKYLHQLQNLYFALAGEELEIKTYALLPGSDNP